MNSLIYKFDMSTSDVMKYFTDENEVVWIYPVIVSKNNLNKPLAYLNNIQNDDCTIHKSINGEDTLSFTAVIEELKTDFLYDENNVILVDDDLYKPLTLTEQHHENGLLTINVD